MTTYVKGIELPELNGVHREMIDLFNEEHEGLELERIDHVEVIDDYTVRIFTSRFIELTPRLSSGLSLHLQIMSTYRMYDNDPDSVDHMNDPYCEYEMDRRYREVYISNVYRTLDGDKGWIVGYSGEGAKYRADDSELHVWDGRI
jgi:hypothetical protein